MKISFLFCKLILICIIFLTCDIAMARQAVIVKLTGGSKGAQSFTSISGAIASLQNDPASTYGNANFTLGNTYGGTFDILGIQFGIGVSVTGTVTYSFTDVDGNTVSGNVSDFASFEKFLQSDTDKVNYRKFIKVLQKNAIFNYISGPNSPVSRSVHNTTMRAMGPTFTQAERTLFSESDKRRISISIGGEDTRFETTSFNGEGDCVPIQISGYLTKWMNFDLQAQTASLSAEGSEFDNHGFELDLGFVILGQDPTEVIEWEIGPTIGTYSLAADDLLLRGNISNYGVQNRLQANLGPLSLVLGSYYGVYKSTDFGIESTDIDLCVDTRILSNGLKVMLRVGPNFVLEAYETNSRPFSDDDGFHELQRVGIAINGQFNIGAKNSGVIRVGYSQDKGKDPENEDYEAECLEASLMFRF